MAQRMADKTVQQQPLAPAQRRGAKTVAVAARLNGFGAPAFDQLEPGQNTGAWSQVDCMLADPPVERGAMAQYRIDVTRDMRPVFGADVPAMAEIIRRNI